ncbi:MAG: tetratricopeptide repeat protein [Nitrospirota bacterium]
MGSQKGIIIENAQQFAAKGKLDKAIAEWKKLIVESPQDGNIYNNISDLYLRMADKPSAIDACLKAAGAYRETGFESKGIAVLKKILRIDSNRIDIYEMLADIDADRGLAGNAVEGYQQTAKMYVKNGNFRSAVGVYQKLLRFVPDDPEVPLSIARLYQKQEKFREAILFYEKAEAIYDSKNMVSDAHQVVEEIIKIDPAYLKHLVAKESAVAALGGSAITTNRDYVRAAVVKNSMEASNPMGEIVQSESEPTFSDDIEIFRDLIPEESPSEIASSISSVAKMEEGISSVPVESLPDDEVWSQAQSVSDAVLNTHLSEAEAYARYGLNQNAIEKLCLVTQLSPTNEAAYIQLHELYLREGETQKAVEASVALAEIYKKNRNFEKNNSLFNRVREIDPVGEYHDIEMWKTVLQQPESDNTEGISQVSSKEKEIPPLLEEVKDNPFLEAVRDHSGARSSWNRLAPPKEVNAVESLDLSSITDQLGNLSADFPSSTQKKKAGALSDPKVGVEKLGQEQYSETCYHLGIAQKEMGNFTKAIREFEQALTGGSKRFQEVVSILAGCYAEQGDLQQAVMVLQNGLNDSRCVDGIRLAISYELALIHEQMGEKEKAFPIYKEIYSVNPNFRDVAGKVKEIPYRKTTDEGYVKEATLLSLDAMRLKEKPGSTGPIKEKRRISYV